MSREIKFRVWDSKKKEFTSNYREVFFPCWCIENIEKPQTTVFSGYRTSCIVQQYTGIKDKNGKEIYEGDIVAFSRFHPIDEEEFEDFKEVGIIEWAKTRYGKKPGFEIVNDDRAFYGEWPEEEYIFIIGNIFENGELLNK